MRVCVGAAIGVGFGCCVGCGHRAVDAPPTIAYGQTDCSECGMVIGDERFACATIVRAAGGGVEARVFDDVNCMVLHETTGGPPLDVVARWVHDRDTRRWVRADAAHFVLAPGIETPMMSHVASFAEADSANDAAKAAGDAKVRTFDDIFALFRPEHR